MDDAFARYSSRTSFDKFPTLPSLPLQLDNFIGLGFFLIILVYLTMVCLLLQSRSLSTYYAEFFAFV